MSVQIRIVFFRAIMVLTCLVMITGLKGQNRIRSFNLGVVGNLGIGNNLYIEDLGNTRVLRSYLPGTSSPQTLWYDTNGESVKNKLTHQVGARLKFQSEGKKGHMWGMGLTYTKTRVSYYIENLYPFLWGEGNYTVNAWHTWVRFHSLYFHLQRSWAWNSNDRSFFYFKIAGGFSKLSAEKLRARKGLQNGITGSGQEYWIYEGEGAIIDHKVGETYIPMVQPEIGIQFQFGRHDMQTFQLGLSYTLPLEPLVQSDYIAYSNYQAFSLNRINYDGEHVAIQAAYSFPIKRYFPQSRINDKEGKIMRRQNRKSKTGEYVD